MISQQIESNRNKHLFARSSQKEVRPDLNGSFNLSSLELLWELQMEEVEAEVTQEAAATNLPKKN